MPTYACASNFCNQSVCMTLTRGMFASISITHKHNALIISSSNRLSVTDGDVRYCRARRNCVLSENIVVPL